MSWLLDTNACIGLMKLHGPLTTKAREIGPAELAVSSITLAELWFGAASSERPQRSRDDQDAFLAPFRVVDFDAAAADRYALAKAVLVARGRPIGDRDLMIAAIALANRMTVVTNNVSEFTRVPGLTVEDWTV
jgi:tRNA(fMet)-specific endonuclease VapC